MAPEKQLNNDIYVVSSCIIEIYGLDRGKIWSFVFVCDRFRSNSSSAFQSLSFHQEGWKLVKIKVWREKICYNLKINLVIKLSLHSFPNRNLFPLQTSFGRIIVILVRNLIFQLQFMCLESVINFVHTKFNFQFFLHFSFSLQRFNIV
jgi:hypothetical protein